ncbi:hypothetical protein GCM10007856_12200 [Azospirillum oryzae]|nr:hypothetical protein GCM10007856_12200 [Azospirillum oryzae]
MSSHPVTLIHILLTRPIVAFASMAGFMPPPARRFGGAVVPFPSVNPPPRATCRQSSSQPAGVMRVADEPIHSTIELLSPEITFGKGVFIVGVTGKIGTTGNGRRPNPTKCDEL